MNRRAIHHVALGARDVERVATFYRELFGLPEIERHLDDAGALRSIWMDAGGVILMVEKTGAHRERVEGVGSGPFLLAFHIETHERKPLELELEKRGIFVESRTEFTSYARDPEGNRVALCHFPNRVSGT